MGDLLTFVSDSFIFYCDNDFILWVSVMFLIIAAFKILWFLFGTVFNRF